MVDFFTKLGSKAECRTSSLRCSVIKFPHHHHGDKEGTTTKRFICELHPFRHRHGFTTGPYKHPSPFLDGFDPGRPLLHLPGDPPVHVFCQGFPLI